MSIQEIQIKGFRSLRDVTWRPGPLNVIIGPNGSGKSNLLRALELLQASAEGKLRNTILKEGGIQRLLWDQDSPELSWRLTLDGHMITGDNTDQVNYELVLDSGEDHSPRLNYFVAKESLTVRAQQASGVPDDVSVILTRDARSNFANYKNPEESLLSVQAESRNEIRGLEWVLNAWRIYHDLRADRQAPIRRAAVTSYETYLDRDGQNLIALLHTLYEQDPRFEEELDNVLSAAFEDFEKLKFPPAEDQKIQLRVKWKSLSKSLPIADLSDGTIRFLLLSAILLTPNPPPLIAIDEPETGLHPRMFPILAELARDAAERTQVIFTTHSPEFLDAFSEFVPTVTVSKCTKGQTELSVVDGEELNRWLKEYRLGELYRSNELQALA